MDSKLLLVNTITLLYMESLVANANENSADLAKEIVTSIKLPEVEREVDQHREAVIGLRATALWMIEQPHTTKYDRSTILQRIRVNVGNDDSLYAAFESWVADATDQDEIKRTCIHYREVLKTYLSRSKIKEILKNASTKVLFQEDTIDWKHFVREVAAELEPFANDGGLGDPASMVDIVDFTNVDKLQEVMTKAVEESNSDGILQTGIQALNRMFGEHAGFRRGDFVVVGALQHNFKTGFTLNLYKHFALYNTPYLRDETRKPLLVHLSFENHLNDNIMWLYINLKENETGEPCDTTMVSIDEASAYIAARMQERGYHIKMMRFDPSDFTYHDMFSLIQGFESEGYEVHAIVCDYLNMMSKRGTSGGASGADVRDLFRRVRNFCSPRGILFITPHQLSPDAKYLVRQGVDNFVQEVANKGYWDSCKAIDQEVDMEIIIHIEKVNGESYLTVQRGKHRKPRPTPEAHLYTVLKFEPVGAILDDINGVDLSSKKVGSVVSSDGTVEEPWWG